MDIFFQVIGILWTIGFVVGMVGVIVFLQLLKTGKAQTEAEES